MGVDSGALLKTLNPTCLKALQAAAGLCVLRSNPTVELEHWLMKLLEDPGSDFVRVLGHFEVDVARFTRDLTRVLDQFRTGNQRTPTLAHGIEDLVRSAWVLASIEYQAGRIRSGVLVLALLEDESLGRLAREASGELARIKIDVLRSSMAKIVAGSGEDETPAAASALGAARACVAMNMGTHSPTPALDQYTVNLTERARSGAIDPVVGRAAEVRSMVDILIRRRQNNPILTGEAGVGKTAVVEGLALRIAQGDVPEPLKTVELRALDLGLLQAGAGVKGEFESRLKQVISEVKSSPVPVILFIDEAHTMIGAGGQAGQNDAANLLKPALARGELRTIAATTWAEYKKYFEKDAALARRFQMVKIEEPDLDRATAMMRGLASMLEAHHGVRILDEAVTSAVKLSHRYIPARQLPDKAVSLLDTACAQVAIGQTAVPPAVEDRRGRIAHLEVEIGILDRETAVGADHADRLATLQTELERTRAGLVELERTWAQELARVREIRALAGRVEALHATEMALRDPSTAADASPELKTLQGELAAQTAALQALQGETPLLQASVDAQTIAQVIAGWTGIPVGKMLANEIQTVLKLKDKLQARVIGQPQALEAIALRIQTARANLTDPRRPIGVFLLVGPSGVGKTETALALADALHGGERNLITINMSEYQESHTVSALKGSSPGYVGYGEGGVLTEAVRRRPYSVILLDEVEKAHPDVLELFFQVFDKGVLEDGEGREIDFKNTVILLASNVGGETILKLCGQSSPPPDPETLALAIRPDLLEATSERGAPIFKQAFLGRMIVVPYYPISDAVMRGIVELQLERIRHRMRQNHNAELSYPAELVAEIAGRCREVESGARNVDHILTRTLLPAISAEILGRMAQGRPINRVRVAVDAAGGFQYRID